MRQNFNNIPKVSNVFIVDGELLRIVSKTLIDNLSFKCHVILIQCTAYNNYIR